MGCLIVILPTLLLRLLGALANVDGRRSKSKRRRRSSFRGARAASIPTRLPRSLQALSFPDTAPGSLRVSMSGSAQAVRIALQEMHDAFELDLQKREPDRTQLANIQQPSARLLSFAESMAFFKSRTERLTAALQFVATYHPVTTNDTIALKMSVAFSALLDAITTLQTDLAQANAELTFVVVFRGLNITCDRLYAELQTWPAIVQAAERAVAEGQSCDFRLPFTLDMTTVNIALHRLGTL
jgi:hypothetical protein